MTARILIGHVLDQLAMLPDESVHCVVTSPPYYGLRNYGIEPQVWGDDWRGSLGLEPTLALYLDHMVEVFREVRRVMRKDATCWLNIGDSYASQSGAGPGFRPGSGRADGVVDGRGQRNRNGTSAPGFKPKDLMMVPARLAIRLQDDGWWVRSDICWAKKAPMPESCTDRPTSAWEHVFLLTKSAHYYYDAEAVKEEANGDAHEGRKDGLVMAARGGIETGGAAPSMPRGIVSKRNMRNVWLLGPEPFPGAHFATYPTEIPRRAILAGSKPDDTILDPFLGSGTTALVADQLGRNCIGIELNPEYTAMARRRIEDDAPLLADVAD